MVPWTLFYQSYPSQITKGVRVGEPNLTRWLLPLGLMLSDFASRDHIALLDFAGFRLIGDSIVAAAKATYPESGGGFTFTLVPVTNPKPFRWAGIDWTAPVILSHLALLVIALGIVLVSGAFFDRFNPSTTLPRKRNGKEADAINLTPTTEAATVATVPLTPVRGRRDRFHIGALFGAELRLLLKGHNRSWYAIALGLIAGQLFSPLEVTHWLLVAAWAWHILLMSNFGGTATASH